MEQSTPIGIGLAKTVFQGRGVEAICRVPPIAPSTHHHHQAIARDPSKASLRALRDADLAPKTKAAPQAGGTRHGAVKVRCNLADNDVLAARCTVVRPMKEAGLQGVARGKGKGSLGKITDRVC